MLKLLPLFALILGVGAGLFAGQSLRPDAEMPMTEAETEPAREDIVSKEKDSDPAVEFIKLNNQFIVPVIGDNAVRSLVVVSLGLEVLATEAGRAFSAEPKLRDAFLQILFDHANIGGFDAEFTNARKLNFLREALTVSAQNILGETVVSVLITDLARQDV